ncbi:MAG: superoxide dismutase [Pseudomonadota bacterium]
MAFALPGLPYETDALEPHVSADTFSYHHGKHHNAYISKLNAALETEAGEKYAGMSLVEITRRAAADGDQDTFNNAAQSWNHEFLWHSMAPNGGGEPSGRLAEAVNSAFGSLDAFKEQFAAAAAGQFGSGWAWLVATDSGLEIRATGNAETPLTESGVKPLLTLDVWEHAYYLDHQNNRPGYISAFLDHLINWEFAANNFA